LYGFLAHETLFDRTCKEDVTHPQGVLEKPQLLAGIAGFHAVGRPTVWTVIKHLLSITILPYLILPCSPLSFPSSPPPLLTPSSRYIPLHGLHVDHQHHNHSNPIHQTASLPLHRHSRIHLLPSPHDRRHRRQTLGLLVRRLPLEALRPSPPRCLRTREPALGCLACCLFSGGKLGAIRRDVAAQAELSGACVWLGAE
jgi:hypothetical protein